MKNYFIEYTSVLLIITIITFPLLATAHDSTDQSHGIKVETINSNMGSPRDIHIEISNDGIIVSGKIKRLAHRNLKLRGYVDIDLLDEEGHIISHVTSRLSTTLVKASRNRFKRFNSSLPVPPTETFSVRVSHTTRKLDHKQ